MTRWNMLLAGGAMLAATAATPGHAADVFSNNSVPGDTFTVPGGSNQGQAVGTTGWYYNNVRNGASVGINDTLPRSGNGSAAFSSPSGAGKADIEFLANAVNVGGNFFAAGSLGALSGLTSMSYEWYRNGSSTNPAAQQPALRILVDVDGNLTTGTDRSGLVFEQAYNGGPASAATNTWVLDNVNGATNLWSFGSGAGGLGFATGGYGISLAAWQANPLLANAVIVGFSSGVGSGWNGVFDGAVDNVSWTINGVTTTSNFEVQAAAEVPEPAAMAVFGIGVAALAAVRRRRASQG